MAAMNSIETNLPQTTVNGCYFNFCQSIYRRVQAYELQSQYTNNINVTQHIRYIAALAFVPPADVMRWYEVLKKFALFKTKLSSKSDNGFKRLLKYAEATWIGSRDRAGNCKPDLFKIEVWTVEHVRHGVERTTTYKQCY